MNVRVDVGHAVLIKGRIRIDPSAVGKAENGIARPSEFAQGAVVLVGVDLHPIIVDLNLGHLDFQLIARD